MTANNKIKILAVVGSTASGKTALSIALAKTLGGEIVSCDSMQLYRAMLESVMPYFSGKTDDVPLDAMSLVMPELTALAAKQSWLNNGAEVFITDIDDGYKSTEAIKLVAADRGVSKYN